VVARLLAKEKVAGSNPVSRSTDLSQSRQVDEGKPQPGRTAVCPHATWPMASLGVEAGG